MLNNKCYLGGYYKEDSRIHKCSPKIKIITLLILTIALIFSQNIHNIILLNLYIFIIILYSNISLKIYLTHMLNFKILIISIFILTLIITKSLVYSMNIGINVIDFLILITTLIMTTTPLEINSSLTQLLDNKIFNFKKIIRNITLCILTIPLIKETQEQIKIAKKIRGLDPKIPNKKEKIKSLLDNLEPTIRLTKNKMNRISNVMEIKNYSYFNSRRNYKKPKNKIDKIAILLDLIILALVIID